MYLQWESSNRLVDIFIKKSFEFGGNTKIILGTQILTLEVSTRYMN